MRRKPSLKDKILLHLRDKQAWEHKGTIENLAKEWGYLGETSGRECRRLEEDGLILSERYGRSQRYRATPPDRVDRFIVKGQGVGGVDKKLEVPVYD
ncbi:MAG TPA: hypothetical protein ENI23_08755 [bacterium]|nr:hypothetical protein [bacterium]